MEIGLVQKIDIDHEMQQAYLDYAMSVIVARALPDARDGLKPVHRRILYAMYDMGLRPDSAYKKSARIVGEVLGKYHPHGDMAVYEAMARMAQDFSMRYMLVDGQGNFGSVDGDPPAAMRYTEARLYTAALSMLADIEKSTVNFDDNFDGTLQEPAVLPAAIPNLLVNGATGIAVGMSTSIPPHNLGEVVKALQHMLAHWNAIDDISLDDLMQFIQGPDFPTGGVIIQDAEGDALLSAYGSGRGRVTVQARAHLEEMDRGRSRIIISELPYMTNKSGLIERIATLVREERLEGIADLRDESDRHGMRIVIELSRGTDAEGVLRDLYKSTPMRSTFSIIMLALVDGEPRLLSLKQALRVYIEHRLEIIKRRSQFELDRAKKRAHILEGLRIALKNLDEIINLIRKAPDADVAKERLIKRYHLSDLQAQAILDMQLRRLASLERKKIEDEYREIVALIKELEALLRSPAKMRQAVSDELQAVSEAFGDSRRTHIVRLKEGEKKQSLLTATDLAPDTHTWITVSSKGMIARHTTSMLPGWAGEDAPRHVLQAHTRDVLYLVTEQGEAAAILAHSIPEATSASQGMPVHKISPLREGQQVVGLFSLPALEERPEDQYILTTTRQGMVKKSALSELPGASAGTFTLVKVNDGDRLAWLQVSDGQKEVLLATRNGMAIRFSEEEVRPMGLVAAGVMGIKLQAGDEVAGAVTLPASGDILLVSTDAAGKRLAPGEFPRQGRYGQGVTGWKLAGEARITGVGAGEKDEPVILHFENREPYTLRCKEIPLASRAARGKALLKLKAGERVTAITLPLESALPGAQVSGMEDGGKPAPGGTPRRKTTDEVQPATPVKPGGRGKPAAGDSDGKVRSARRAASTTSSKDTASKKQPAKSQTTRSAKSGSQPARAGTKAAAKEAVKLTSTPGVKAPRSAGKTSKRAAETTSARVMKRAEQPSRERAPATKASKPKAASAKSATRESPALPGGTSRKSKRSSAVTATSIINAQKKDAAKAKNKERTAKAVQLSFPDQPAETKPVSKTKSGSKTPRKDKPKTGTTRSKGKDQAAGKTKPSAATKSSSRPASSRRNRK